MVVFSMFCLATIARFYILIGLFENFAVELKCGRCYRCGCG